VSKDELPKLAKDVPWLNWKLIAENGKVELRDPNGKVCKVWG
jgi:hypothetical protein